MTSRAGGIAAAAGGTLKVTSGPTGKVGSAAKTLASKPSPSPLPEKPKMGLNDLIHAWTHAHTLTQNVARAEREAAEMQRRLERILAEMQQEQEGAVAPTYATAAAATSLATQPTEATQQAAPDADSSPTSPSSAAVPASSPRSRSLSLHARREHIAALRQKLDADTAALARQRATVLARRQALQPKLALLKSAHSTQLSHRETLDRAARKQLGDLKLQLHLIQLRQSFRRRTLLHHLSSIYPLSPPRTALKPSQSLQHPLMCYTIRGLRLPNNHNNILTSFEEEQVSTALGYVCHLMVLLAKYLEIPLRYRMIFRGSRSVICDDVTASSQFPLYFKNMEERRFELGVILLNKNIEQMLQVRLSADGSSPYSKNMREITFTLENLAVLFQNEMPQ